jgi:transcriptional regulator GlxA family with amidase domain
MRFGIVVYEGVEPIDIGATFGVLSMARRVEPGIEMFLVAGRAGVVRRAGTTGVVASVCTGAMLLAAAGLLDGRRATTKREVTGAEVPPIAILRDRHPAVRVLTARVVDEGAVVTGGGVSLAIDLTLHLIGRLCGATVAAETARIIEYTAAWRANAAAFEEPAPAT